MSEYKNSKSLKEKANRLYWGWLRTKALELDNLKLNKFYVYGFTPVGSNSYPESAPQVVDIKFLRSVEKETDTEFHLSDGSSVVHVKKTDYTKTWVLCDVNLEITRTSDKIDTLHKTLEWLEEFSKWSKDAFPQPGGVSYPTLPNPNPIGPFDQGVWKVDNKTSPWSTNNITIKPYTVKTSCSINIPSLTKGQRDSFAENIKKICGEYSDNICSDLDKSLDIEDAKDLPELLAKLID